MTSALLHVGLLSRYVLFPLAAYVLACRFSGQRIAPWLRAALVALTAVVVIGSLKSVVSAIHYVGEWDFVCFWLYGHAAAAGGNVFEPATYHALSLPIPVDADFRREVLDVGFPYPPASIFLFLPLGYGGNFALASALWLVAMVAALVAGAIILIRTYVPKSDLDAAVAIGALVIGLPAVAENITYHQTNFLAFALLAAAYALRGGIGGGVAAALAIVVKPYLAVVALWFLLRRRWNALAASILTFAAITIAAIPALGSVGLHSFFASNPTTRLPPSVYVEPGTASLYAFLLRLEHREGPGAFHDPIYIAIALISAALTVWLVAKASERDDDLSLAFAVALGLMLYPGTGTMYAIALVPALVAVARATAGLLQRVAFALFALAFFIANGANGSTTFVAFAALWLVAAILLVRAGRTAAIRSTSSP
jgi:hypothetical protein